MQPPSSDKGIPLDRNDPNQRQVADQFKQELIDIQSKLYDKTAAYNNIILVVGYAGVITFWSYAKSELNLRINILTVLLLGFSLLIFILYEIYKIGSYIRHYNNVRILISDLLPAPELLKRINEIKSGHEKTILTLDTRIAAIVLVLSGSTLLLSLGILYYNFCAILLGLPLWPR